MIEKSLWEHQKIAIEKWNENSQSGILAMATGSGKTYTALVATRDSIETAVIIIIVPTITLLEQWKKEIEDFDPGAAVILCGSNYKEWRKEIPLRLGPVRDGMDVDDKNIPALKFYILSTVKTAASQDFLNIVSGASPKHSFVIVDEVHHIGAPKSRACLSIPASKRIGLSATPDRYWDTEGTNAIKEYFGPTVYEFSIEEAIEKGFLCHYDYHPLFAYLEDDEFYDFMEMTAKINRRFAQLKQKKEEDVNSDERYQQLLIKRSRIKKKAKDKARVFGEFAKKDLEKPVLVFCEDHEQVKELLDVLGSTSIHYLTYTSRQNYTEQRGVLDRFKKKDIDMLLAIRCLDEGLDVPECSTCLIVASSTSTREFIQRRGRVLRLAGKKKANVYDIVILPTSLKSDQDREIATKMIKPEISRVNQMADAADNKYEVKNHVRTELEKIGLESLSNV